MIPYHPCGKIDLQEHLYILAERRKQGIKKESITYRFYFLRDDFEYFFFDFLEEETARFFKKNYPCIESMIVIIE